MNAKPAPSAESGPVVLVGRITTPLALQDGRIRYREGLNEVGGYEYHRWTDPPGIMVKDSLVHVLRASGAYKAVQDTGSSVTGDYVVRGKLLDFRNWMAAPSQPAFPSSWNCVRSKPAASSGTNCSPHDDPAQAKTVADVVQSMDRNLQGVLGEAASGIGSYIAAHPLSH